MFGKLRLLEWIISPSSRGILYSCLLYLVEFTVFLGVAVFLVAFT